ncbi:MAG: hypothetical protein FWG11_00120 [Promicromonosporaceae bacterium]|nr:hypothetical protein [Promicromonosporaceae bacterium]
MNTKLPHWAKVLISAVVVLIALNVAFRALIATRFVLALSVLVVAGAVVLVLHWAAIYLSLRLHRVWDGANVTVTTRRTKADGTEVTERRRPQIVDATYHRHLRRYDATIRVRDGITVDAVTNAADAIESHLRAAVVTVDKGKRAGTVLMTIHMRDPLADSAEVDPTSEAPSGWLP